MRSPSPKTKPMETAVRVVPYLLSWSILAALMILGMERVPSAIYRPIDGDWAKWNVEAILHFGNVFDLSPYSMLAGMGSMYFPNLPWLNPGALALALPLGDATKNIVSYAIYAAELAGSILVLGRVIGFSWLMSTAAAQFYLYLLFPPFAEVFRIYDWYSLAPYYAHLQAVLNGAAAVLHICGRLRDWRGNALLAMGFLALFISGLLSAPFTFLFATPAYVVVSAAVIVARRPSLAEWAWKMTALALCLMFFFGSGLPDYYLGTIATAGRTPAGGLAWDRLLSAHEWIRFLREHSLCGDPRLLLCIGNRGAWLQIAALCGTALAIFTRHGDIRAAAWALIAYIGLAHVYAYAFQTGWLGPISVLSSHFIMLSAWTFISIFAVFAFIELFSLVTHPLVGSRAFDIKRLAGIGAIFVIAALLALVVVKLLAHPYESHSYRATPMVMATAGIAGLLVIEIIRTQWDRQPLTYAGLGRMLVLLVFPILALVHLSIGVREPVPAEPDVMRHAYLNDHAAIKIGNAFRGYAATIWLKDRAEDAAGAGQFNYSLNRLDETFRLWRSQVPTFEEYGEWTSAQAHAFVKRLLGPPAGTSMHTNYLRAHVVDADILRLLGIRYIITDVESLDRPAIFRQPVTASEGPEVYLFELGDANLGTYSPTRFVKAATADEIADRIRENKDHLDQVAVVADDVPPTNAKARNAVMTVERDGVRIRATGDGSAHILLPVQFSHCLVVVNGSPARLTRANLLQTLVSFDGALDARLEFRFGLFADNKCRIRDGQDNKALGL